MLSVDADTETIELNDQGLQDDGLIRVCETLDEVGNTALEVLELRRNNISTRGVLALAATLLNGGSSLRVLDLSLNDIWPEGIGALAKPQVIGKVQQLSLNNNHVQDLGLKFLSNCLYSFGRHLTLTTLHLNQNNITDAGVLHLATALKHNKTLKEIHLDDNKIGDIGGKSLGDTLKSNHNLISLSLAGNLLRTEAIKAIADGASSHKELLYLDLSRNPVENEARGLAHLQTARQCVEGNLYMRVAKIKFAFALGLHKRVGVKSPVRVFMQDPEVDKAAVLANVWEFLGQV